MSGRNISAPAPYFANHPYGSGGGGRKQSQNRAKNIQDSELHLQGLTALRLDDGDDVGAEQDEALLLLMEGRRRHHHRDNSEGVSPIAPHMLPTAGRSGAHRHMGSSNGIDPLHEHNELPPSAETTAISSTFHLYRAAAERGRWEAMALGYDHHGTGAGASAGGKKKAKSSSSKAVMGLQQQQYQEPRTTTSQRSSSSSSSSFPYQHLQSRLSLVDPYTAHSTQAHARARSTTAGGPKKHSRSGMPHPSFQLTAPKADRIGRAIGAFSGVHSGEASGGAGSVGVGCVPPVTSNSNLDAAAVVVRVAGAERAEGQEGEGRSRHGSIGSSTGSFRQVYDRRPDGSFVRRTAPGGGGGGLDPAMLDPRLSSSSSSSSSTTYYSSASSSSSSSSARAVSPLLDHSQQTFVRVPVETAAADEAASLRHPQCAQNFSSALLRPRGLSSSTHHHHHQQQQQQRRLTTDVLSPTNSSSLANESVYGPRNLATVGCRTSSSVVSASLAAEAAMDANTTTAHHHRRRRSTRVSSSSSSSSLLGKIKDGSLEVLAALGVVTPPSPKVYYERQLVSAKTQAHAQAMQQLALGPPPVLLLPSPAAAKGRGSASSLSVSSSTGNGRRHGRIVTHEMARLPSTMTQQQHSRQLSSSSSSLSSSNSNGSTEDISHATACVRTALEVIIARLQAAQTQGADATAHEARTFIEGGGVDALLRGLETLGQDPTVAHHLLYVLRVVAMDATTRRAAAAGAKGRMLVEHVPVVMHRHLGAGAGGGVGPVVADGLALMVAFLQDPVTRKMAGPLLLTSKALTVVREAKARVGGGSREAALCTEVLKCGAAAASGAL